MTRDELEKQIRTSRQQNDVNWDVADVMAIVWPEIENLQNVIRWCKENSWKTPLFREEIDEYFDQVIATFDPPH